jgi:RND family efflux transporter MFP subunit
MFTGRIARISPVLDPATRTAPIEIEIPNPGFRLKPGMYARVSITTDARKDALVVPSNAVIDFGGRRGVFLAEDGDVVSFRAVTVGIEAPDHIEILEGVADGDRVVTTGAAALREGDRVLVAAAEGGPRGGGARAAAETQDSGPDRAGGRAGRGRRGAEQ